MAIEELRQALAKKSLIVGYSTIRSCFACHAITRKQDRARSRARPAPHPEAAQGMIRMPARARSERLVFIDDPGLRPTWIDLTVAVDPPSACASASLTAIGRRRHSSPGWPRGIIAPSCKVLVPELKPGRVVTMGNLSNHKGHKVRQLIEAAGTSLRYLPPTRRTSIQFENAFAKLKALLRKATQ